VQQQKGQGFNDLCPFLAMLLVAPQKKAIPIEFFPAGTFLIPTNFDGFY